MGTWSGRWYQNPPRHPSKPGVEKLSSLKVQPNIFLSLSVRLRLRLGRLDLGELDGWGRKARTSPSERLLAREGPRMSEAWVMINGVALRFVGSGGVASGSSDSSDSEWVEEEK